MMEGDSQSRGNPEWGYLLDFSPAAADVLHDFCGSHAITGAECPHCHKPLLRLLSLDAKDTRLNLDAARHPLVHLLYCWTCSIPFGEFSYKIKSDGSVELLQAPPRQGPKVEHGEAGPYDGYTGVFPHQRVALRPISDDAQRRLTEFQTDQSVYDESEDDLFEPRHQIGGFPFVYNPTKTFCPVCSMEMPVLAAICDDARGNDRIQEDVEKTFVGSGGGAQMMFQFCRACSVVSAYHSMD
jgi:hypothetical protein